MCFPAGTIQPLVRFGEKDSSSVMHFGWNMTISENDKASVKELYKLPAGAMHDGFEVVRKDPARKKVAREYETLPIHQRQGKYIRGELQRPLVVKFGKYLI